MHSASSYALKIHRVSKSFGATSVLDNLSIEVEKGGIMLLLGANGSGKSTLLRLCAGLSRADSGEISFGSSSVKKGYLSHDLYLYAALTVRENLDFFRSIAAVSLELDKYLEEWELLPYKHKKIRELSKGLQSRVSLARAFISSPKFLFLDEPSSSLDDGSVELLRSKLKGHCRVHPDGCAVVATHDMSRLSETASRAAVLHNGAIGFDSAGSGLQSAVSYYREVNR